MKNKGTVTFFAILFSAILVFHLSFTVKTSLYERKMLKSFNGNEELAKAHFNSIAYKKDFYNVLVKKYTYAECKEHEINLGLDLKGGMHVTLEVAMDQLLLDLAGGEKVADADFKKVISLTKTKQKNSQNDFITDFVNIYHEQYPGVLLNRPFATYENKEEIDRESTDAETLKFLKKQAESAFKTTEEVLKKRIDKFGVTQPNIQSVEGTGRIMIELPGITDPERVKKYLKTAAKLEFWETYKIEEVMPYFEEVNKELKNILELNDGEKKDLSSVEESKDPESVTDFFTENNQESEAEPVDTKPEELAIQTEDVDSIGDSNDLINQIAKDSTKKPEAQLTQEEFLQNNPLYKYLSLSIRSDENGTYFNNPKSPLLGYAKYEDTSLINTYLNYPQIKELLPENLLFKWTAKPEANQNGEKILVGLIALKANSEGEPSLDGKVVTKANRNISQTGEIQVDLKMNAEGAQKWAVLTEKNAVEHTSIAIVLDGLVYSFPSVTNKITGGNSVISGGFSQEEASDLANVLNSGKLNVKINFIEENEVGPSLGQESINKGLISLLVGLILVLLFMIFYYNKGGLVADVALFANLFFIIGVLSSLQAALTLPGIAGIVLTIGMSVDANVLIFERIREELAAGKGIRVAIKDGYQKAYSSIIDANVTTLLVAIILYTFGSGPIHGFATILIIGILTSLFSAILITRIIFDNQLKKEKDLSFDTKLTRNLFNNLNFDFLGWRRKAYIISGTVIVLGIASLAYQGLSLGVDFKGGYQYTVRFDEQVNTAEITKALTQPFGGKQPEVKVFGENNQVKITTSFMIDSTDASETVKTVLTDNLKTINPNFEILQSSQTGPTIADDIKKSAVWSVLFSMVVIFLYIILRFRKWQYGLAAVATPFHDVLVIFSIFSIFQTIMPFSLEIDQAFIAALLTIIGYSMNDTVVVFDRIREKLSLNKHKPFMGTVNTALNETLSRTLITSLTTLVVVLVVFLFGGEIIRGFAFALLIGIVVGTYSSVFVSTPIVVELVKKEYEAKETEKE